MPDQGYKACTKCGVTKSLEDFYACATGKDGRRGDCKTCNRAQCRELSHSYDPREHFESPAAFTEKRRAYYAAAKHRPGYTERRSAYRLVQSAIEAGELTREPCEICGVEPSEAHHEDYSKPLDVRWLCLACHKAEHRIDR